MYVSGGANLTAYNAAVGGAPLWSAAFGSSVVAEPTIVDGRVYATSYDGHLTAFGL